MKQLKNILTLTLLLGALTVFAKNVTTSFTVKGECDMCKDKIEKALDIEGISFAEWDIKSKKLTVRYNDSKITEDKIHSIISNLGYSTSKLSANKDAQNKLDDCCKPKEATKSCCSSKQSCSK